MRNEDRCLIAEWAWHIINQLNCVVPEILFDIIIIQLNYISGISSLAWMQITFFLIHESIV